LNALKVFLTCLGPGLTTAGQPRFWREALTSKNLVVRNNSFVECGLVGAGRQPGTVELTAPGTLALGEPARKIEFTGNLISRPGIMGLHLNNCRDITVTGNISSKYYCRLISSALHVCRIE
jgi:hypothetical protein